MEAPEPMPAPKPAIVRSVEPMPKPKAAPVVAARTFRSGDKHAGHDCPKCGRTVKGNIVSGIHDVTPHVHRCPSCGASWWH